MRCDIVAPPWAGGGQQARFSSCCYVPGASTVFWSSPRMAS